MTPAFVLRGGKPYLVTGSPGGSRIITRVLQLVVNVIDHDMNVAAATMAPRVHHQWLPDELRVEVGLSPDTIRLLRPGGTAWRLRTLGGRRNRSCGPGTSSSGPPTRGVPTRWLWATEDGVADTLRRTSSAPAS